MTWLRTTGIEFEQNYHSQSLKADFMEIRTHNNAIPEEERVKRTIAQASGKCPHKL